MYLTNVKEDVISFFEKIETLDEFRKIKICIYIFNALNSGQINDKNEANPYLIGDDIKIFSFSSIGLPNDLCCTILHYLEYYYNVNTNEKKAYDYDGIVIGVQYTQDDNEIVSIFEKLSFENKLDVISEIIIRLDNESFFEKIKLSNIFDINTSGFNIANLINDYKKQ